MIIPNYAQFRHLFATKITESGVSCQFANSAPDTMSRAAGSFVTQGYAAGMVVEPVGSTSNDIRYTLATVTAGAVEFTSEGLATNEGPFSVDLTAYWLANDGWPEFPGPQTRGTNLVTPSDSGVNLSILDVDQDIVSLGLRLSPNAFAADASPGVDEYHWYLSQRTDDSAKQFLDFSQYDGMVSAGQTASGTVRLPQSALAVTELGISGGVFSIAQIQALYRHCHVYCKRLSDGVIFHTDVLAAILNWLETVP